VHRSSKGDGKRPMSEWIPPQERGRTGGARRQRRAGDERHLHDARTSPGCRGTVGIAAIAGGGHATGDQGRHVEQALHSRHHGHRNKKGLGQFAIHDQSLGASHI